MGAIRGPIMTAIPHISIAAPRWVGGQISAITPPTLLSGAPPKTPEKNRVISKVCMSFAVAVAKENIMSPNMGSRIEIFRP